MSEYLWPPALVVIAWMLCRSSSEWAQAWRYYTEGRAGMLALPPAEDDEPEIPKDGADLLFDAWHEQTVWDTSDEAEYVRGLWAIVRGRRKVGKAQLSEARKELIELAAPMPGGVA